jgi:hypothetical protein
MSHHHEPQHSASLSGGARAVLALLFGACDALLIQGLAAHGETPRLQVLLMASSLSALLVSVLWLGLLAARRGRGWALVVGLGIWLPYVNLVIASVFARRYWSEGARRPALLGLAGLLGQTLASLQLLLCAAPTPL